jgi:ribosomal protein L11
VVEEPAPVEPVVKSKKTTTSSSKLTGVVHLSIIKTHRFQKNSASSALIQERLIELGFADAGSDNRGHLSDMTVKALAKFDEADLNEYLISEATIKKLFEGTAVEVIA